MAQAATSPTPSSGSSSGSTSSQPLTLSSVNLRGPYHDAWRRLLRNRAAIFALFIIALYAVAAIGAPLLAPYDYADQDLMHTTESPSAAHWMGTDQLGRDVFSRLLYGARISFAVAVAAQFVI